MVFSMLRSRFFKLTILAPQLRQCIRVIVTKWRCPHVAQQPLSLCREPLRGSLPCFGEGAESPSGARAPLRTSSVLRGALAPEGDSARSEEHTSELQSRQYLVCRLLLEKKKQASGRH